MSTELNKAVVRQLVEQVFNAGDTSLVDDLLTADFIEHEELPPGVPLGREGVKMLPALKHAAFPDFRATITDMIAEEDKLALRMT